MSELATIKRSITIKTGVVKRLTKEEKTYIQEAEQQQQRIDKFISEGRDEWNVKKQKEVLQDCLKMIPDCKKRLENSIQELQFLLEGLNEELMNQLKEEINTAKQVLEDGKKSLQNQ